MTSAFRHLRPLLISLVALLLTAGIAFAGKPTAVGSGHATASEASGVTVPVAGADEAEGSDQTIDADEDTEPDQETETNQADAGDHCLVDPNTATDEELAALNHGAIVCWAAHQPTPDGEKHGALVSEWARKNHGADASGAAAAKAAAKASRHGASDSSDTP